MAVQKQMLEWACSRAGYSPEGFAQEHPSSKLSSWLSGASQPTINQLEQFAARTHTSVGALLLSSPPDEPIPISDFRSGPTGKPSANLLDIIYICQQRQDWYLEHARLNRQDRVSIVGAATLRDDPEKIAERLRPQLGITAEERSEIPTWTDALRRLIERVEAAGVLVMVSGVVGSNNTRKLNPQEFRGFALSDEIAPVIFINGSDTKAAQIFTLGHELAHIALGQSVLSDATPRAVPSQAVEAWCNRFAAEFLVPKKELEEIPGTDLQSLARRFKVSTLAVLRRLFDVGRIPEREYWSRFDLELERIRDIEARGGGGGNFYYTTMARAGRRLTRALIVSTLEGQSSFSETLRLLGFKKIAAFDRLAEMVGVSG